MDKPAGGERVGRPGEVRVEEGIYARRGSERSTLRIVFMFRGVACPALEDLLEQTDEAWRRSLDEHDVTKRALSEAVTERDILVREAVEETKRHAAILSARDAYAVKSGRIVEQAEHVLDVWDDRNKPEELRAYVPGAFTEAMDELRALVISTALSKNTAEAK